MQFSVIVEGPTEGETTSEDALLELERFLRASDIPSDVISELKNGQPKVLKNQLSYEQAVKISDRLMDLGLDSIIDPPIKPDDSDAKSNVTPIKPNKPKLKSVSPSSNPQKHRSKKPTLSVVNNSSVNNSKREPKQALSPTSNNKKQTTKAPAMAQISSRPKANKTSNVQSKQSSPTAKTTSKQAINTKSAPSSLAKAAAEVKALFHLPTGGAINLNLPSTSRLKLILVASVCLLVPIFYAAIWFSIFYIAASLTSFLYSSISGFSVFLGILIASIPTVLFAIVFTLTNLPLLPRKNNSTSQLVLRAKDEPKLFMLVTAIGKVFKAPSPTSLTLNSSTHVHAKQDGSIIDFFRLNQPLEGDLHLTMGAVLVQNLSIRDFASLVAKEIGIYAHPQLRRPQWIIQHSMRKIGQLKTPHPNFNKQLTTLNQKIDLSVVQKTLALTALLGDKLQSVSCSYFEHAEKLIKICFGMVGPIASKYQQAILADEENNVSSSELVETLLHIEAYHELTIEELLGDSPKSRLAENMPHYSQHLMAKNNGPMSIGKIESDTGLVRSTKAIHSVIGNFNQYACDITRQFYKNNGLNLDDHELCSLKNLFQQEVKDQKFNQASVDYFGDWQHPLQFWKPPAENLLPSNQSDTIVNRLNNCIARVRYVSPDRQASLNRYDKLIQSFSEMKAAKKVIASGNDFHYQRCSESAQSLDRDLAQRRAQIKELQDELRQQNAIMGERLALGLLLDHRHKEFSAKLFQALNVCHSVGEKASSLIVAMEELSHLLRHKPKNQAQQFQLYTRELTEYIRDTEKSIRKKLAHCPFDVIDRRYNNLAEFIKAQEPEYDTLSVKREQVIIQRSKDTLAAVNWAYKQINQRAAYIASAMENKFGVETIKKTDKATT